MVKNFIIQIKKNFIKIKNNLKLTLKYLLSFYRINKKYKNEIEEKMLDSYNDSIYQS